MKWRFGGKIKFWLAVGAIALAAFGLRCWRLEERPMHSDEAVHAVILGEMLESGVYRYNPQDSHGPLLYFLSYPVLRTLGVHDLAEMEAWHLRVISALIGAATVLLLALWADELGVGAVLTAGGLWAVAAPFVYYQRYFIHEGLFVALTLLLLRLLWSWSHAYRSRGFALMTGVVAGLLFATKETASVVFLSLLLAGGCLWLMRARRLEPDTRFRLPSLGSVVWAIWACATVCAILYSSFGMNIHGLADLGGAQFRFAHRALGEGHEKPWWTYLSWLCEPGFYSKPWSGWVVCVVAAAGVFFCWSQPPVRFLSFFCLATGLIYSLIPYKTPWLEMNLLAPAVLLAGLGAVVLFQRARPYQPAVVLLAAAALFGMGRETWQTCFAHPADPRNPLAYSPTVPDVAALATRVAELERLGSDQPGNIQVISTDYWPLPWYLRRLGPIGYWNDVPPTITGAIVVASPDLLPALQVKLGPGWRVEYFGLRPEVLAVVLSRQPADE